MTLPLILALADASESERRDLLHILQEPDALTDAEVESVRQTITRHDGYERTSLVARQYVWAAQAALHALPDSPYRVSLSALADYALTRTR